MLFRSSETSVSAARSVTGSGGLKGGQAGVMADAAGPADAEEAPAADGGGRLVPFAMTDIGVWFPARPQACSAAVVWRRGRLAVVSWVRKPCRGYDVLLLPRYGRVSWKGGSLSTYTVSSVNQGGGTDIGDGAPSLGPVDATAGEKQGIWTDTEQTRCSLLQLVDEPLEGDA